MNQFGLKSTTRRASEEGQPVGSEDSFPSMMLLEKLSGGRKVRHQRFAAACRRVVIQCPR